jgi:hypothetical protein
VTEEDLLPRSFTKEKSLWAIYLQARRIPTNKFNAITTGIVFVLSVLTCWLSGETVAATAKFVRENANLGFNASLAVLGFLVAGFTIFATISNPAMLIRMGGMRHADSGLSWLKYTFFVLIRTFIYYLVFAAFCFSIISFGRSGGLAGIAANWSPYPAEIRFGLVKVASVAMITGQYFLLMQLKSFVFNVYHAVVAALRWRAEGHD